jgi:hypothetical protein
MAIWAVFKSKGWVEAPKKITSGHRLNTKHKH